MTDRTDWQQVTLILSAGIIGACQIGKVAIAVPLLREDLGLSLVVLAWIAGAYAILGLVGGLAAGFVVSYFSLRKVVIGGLCLIATGNLVGILADGASLLIASRLLESLGFLAMVVACPPLLRSVVSQRHQQMVFASWSAYVPVGAVLMLLAGPTIMQGEWRSLWVFNAVLAFANAGAFLAFRPPREIAIIDASRPRLTDITAVTGSPIPMVLAAAFGLHAFQWFALSTFLPALVVDKLGFTLAAAGAISALTLTTNAISNIAAGLFLRRGVSIALIMAATFIIVAGSATLIFAPSSPAILVIIAACGCLGLSGILPSTIIASMPRFAPGSKRLAIAMGILQQASSVGQVLGPVALAFWVDWQGWSTAAYLYALIGVLGLVLTALVYRALATESVF